jgi:hypothetical protein
MRVCVVCYSLKYATNWRSISACEFNSCEDAAVCSETAELLCVTFDICESPSLTCEIASACSFDAAEILLISAETSFAFFTIRSKDNDVASTMPAPLSTRLFDVAISPVVSVADAWLRPARLRTSSATTAKPLPCSPARAASTAAFFKNKKF